MADSVRLYDAVTVDKRTCVITGNSNTITFATQTYLFVLLIVYFISIHNDTYIMKVHIVMYYKKNKYKIN